MRIALARMSKKRSLLTALVALVVLAVAGTTVGYATVSKNVTLSVDGKSREVHTLKGTVRDLLASQHIDLNRRKAVAGALEPIGLAVGGVEIEAQRLDPGLPGEPRGQCFAPHASSSPWRRPGRCCRSRRACWFRFA